MAQVQAVIADLASEYDRSRRFLKDLEQSLRQRPLPPRQDRIDEDADCPATNPAAAAASDGDNAPSDVEADMDTNAAAAAKSKSSSKIASKLKSMFSRSSSQKPQPAAASSGGEPPARSGTRRPSIVNIGLPGIDAAGNEDASPPSGGCPRAGPLLGRTTSFQLGSSAAGGRSGQQLGLHHSSSSNNNMSQRRASLDLYSSSASAQQAAALLASGRVSVEGAWGAPLSCGGGSGGGGGGGGSEPAPPHPARRISGVLLAHTTSLRAISVTATGGGGGDVGATGGGLLPPPLARAPSASAAASRRHHLLRCEEAGDGVGVEMNDDSSDDNEDEVVEAGDAFDARQASLSPHAVATAATAAGMRRASFTHRRPATADDMGGSEAVVSVDGGASRHPAAAGGLELRASSMRLRNSLLAGSGSASHRALAVAVVEDGGSSPQSGPQGFVAAVPGGGAAACCGSEGAATARGHTPLSGTRSFRTLQMSSQLQPHQTSPGGGGPSPAAAAMLHSHSMRARPGSMPMPSLLVQPPSAGNTPNSNRNSMSQVPHLLPDIASPQAATAASAGPGRADSGRHLCNGIYGNAAHTHAGGALSGAGPATAALRVDSSRRLSSSQAALVPTGAGGFQGTMHLI
ncbi:hypothetical protein HXX76_010518 [Chlamydomonas incerta]|uniref:Uncharacterized protein n=1 Tax=Chlamydomonas incerta TaxID=51695 RepID=A0A835VXQ5_CHLIN|nr:hypothetical protein HXX76_010518 [Chlamydomonas incerta]|eukprot:KAG2429733.1 hypothetical protein HXX76_010518 [Chlamydomonas incerta]